ncbi:MAG: hypothetical protein M1608_13470 [Candidatus Omnitrophica bacterium]|nr:hypothetical protein [Candidatus Omnitrophota bacterium]
MPTFDKAGAEIMDLLWGVCKYESHKPIREAGVKIDVVLAYADRDDKGQARGTALQKDGRRALGITRKLGLKDRAMGRGDAEITLDGDYWLEAGKEQQAALLDHELTHLVVKMDQAGFFRRDPLKRPILGLRLHDIEVGWFVEVAKRHEGNSLERGQALMIMDSYGQYFWPEIVGAKPGAEKSEDADKKPGDITIQISGEGFDSGLMSEEQFSKAVKNIKKRPTVEPTTVPA